MTVLVQLDSVGAGIWRVQISPSPEQASPKPLPELEGNATPMPAQPPSAGIPLPAQPAPPPAAPAPLAPAAKPAPVITGGTKPRPQVQLEPGEPRLNYYLRVMKAMRASDLHMSSEVVPMVRVDGSIQPLEEGGKALSHEELFPIFMEVAPEKNREEFDRVSDTDFAHTIEGLSRFRANLFMDRKGIGGVFRQIPFDILSVEQIGLPQKVLDLCWLSKGLVLVTGPTGSGKSTTLATLIDFINQNREDHIITIEDPIEFVHPNKKCLVNQREIGTHTKSFKSALRAALREDPDIVLVGEMRRGGDRGDGPLGLRHPPHHERPEHRRPHHRSVPARSAGADPRDALGVAAWRRRAGALQEDRWRSRGRLRDHDRELRRREPHPRGKDLPAQERHADGSSARDADDERSPARAREGRPRRAGRGVHQVERQVAAEAGVHDERDQDGSRRGVTAVENLLGSGLLRSLTAALA